MFSELVLFGCDGGMVVLMWFVVGCVVIWLCWFKSALWGSWCCCLRG